MARLVNGRARRNRHPGGEESWEGREKGRGRGRKSEDSEGIGPSMYANTHVDVSHRGDHSNDHRALVRSFDSSSS